MNVGRINFDRSGVAILPNYVRHQETAILQKRILELEARVRQLEAELNQPKHLRWQAPINRETTE